MPNNPSPRLSTGQAAKLIRDTFDVPCDPVTIRRWIDAGILPAVETPSGRHYVRAEDVLACVRSASA